jgi:hypothetical protein
MEAVNGLGFACFDDGVWGLPRGFVIELGRPFTTFIPFSSSSSSSSSF